MENPPQDSLTYFGPITYIGIAMLLIALPLGVATSVAQETQEGDPRVRAALDKLKFKYKINKNKAYELSFNLKEDRSQIVFVNSKTQEFGKLEIREVTSTAYKVKGKLPAEHALNLLADNDRRKWGAWRSVEEDDSTFVIYAVQIPADADAAILDNAIDAAILTADKMEREITGEDNF